MFLESESLLQSSGTAIAVLVLAAGLDRLVGDPWHWLHPVQVQGWVISAYTDFAFRLTRSPRVLRILGVVLMVLLVVGSGAVAWGIVAVGRWLHPLLGILLETILLASCLAGRSLRDAAEDVLEPVRHGDLDCARQRLSLYVGRDTEKLSIPEILRAILETVAENTVDGVTSPLFYGVVGSILSPGCAACFALAYKAASTLDSMIGYKSDRYRAIGWCSARTEDFLTWLPCRLTVVTLALLSGSPRHLWQQCRQEAILDPSPNSGWSECAYAVALGVQLGGTNTYGGVVKHKPLLGQPLRPIDAEVVQQALQLTRTTVLLWLSVGVLGVGLRYGMLAG